MGIQDALRITKQHDPYDRGVFESIPGETRDFYNASMPETQSQLIPRGQQWLFQLSASLPFSSDPNSNLPGSPSTHQGFSFIYSPLKDWPHYSVASCKTCTVGKAGPRAGQQTETSCQLCVSLERSELKQRELETDRSNVRAHALVATVLPTRVTQSPGAYADEEGLSTCKLCPAGRIGRASGALSKGDCIRCPRGKYSDAAGQTRCTSCPQGRYGHYPADNVLEAYGTCKDDSESRAKREQTPVARELETDHRTHCLHASVAALLPARVWKLPHRHQHRHQHGDDSTNKHALAKHLRPGWEEEGEEGTCREG